MAVAASISPTVVINWISHINRDVFGYIYCECPDALSIGSVGYDNRHGFKGYWSVSGKDKLSISIAMIENWECYPTP